LLLLVVAREQRQPQVQLGEHAACAPHVDGLAVWVASDYLWRAVVAGLDVVERCLVRVHAGAEVYEFYT
jgi:hypothetical protein